VPESWELNEGLPSTKSSAGTFSLLANFLRSLATRANPAPAAKPAIVLCKIVDASP